MTDIIVRLEQRYEQTAVPECDLIQEAALVIDRLRDELADVRADAALLREQVASLQASSGYEASIAQVEIERLTGIITCLEGLRQCDQADNARLRAALQSLTTDPPATLDEPDTDAEVVIKMREIARRALEPKP